MGNSAPSRLEPPSEAQIGDLRIIKFGAAGRSSGDSTKYRVRYCFLLHSRLILARAGKWSPTAALTGQTGLDVKKKYAIFFCPGMTITRQGRVVTLAHTIRKFSLPWLIYPVSIQLGSDWINLRLPTEALAQEWEEAIRAQCNTPRIPKQIFNQHKHEGSFNAELHGLVMKSSLTGNKALLSFLLAPEQTDSIFNQLHANSGASGRDDPSVLAYMVDRCALDVVDRCLLLFVVLPALTSNDISRVLSECSKGILDAVKALPQESMASNRSVLSPIVILLRSLSDDAALRKSFLQILGHPAGNVATSCLRNTESGSSALDWGTDYQWLRTLPDSCGEIFRIETVEEIALMAQSPLLLLLRLLNHVQRHCRARNIERDVFAAIPPEHLMSEFAAMDDTGLVTRGAHFLTYFLTLGHVERQQSMQQLKRSNQISDMLFQALLREGLKMQMGAQAVSDIAHDLVFSNKEYCENDFSATFVELIPSFAPIVVQEIHRAKADLFSSDPDACRLIVTFVFRLEDCASRRYTLSPSYTFSLTLFFPNIFSSPSLHSEAFRNAHVTTVTTWMNADTNYAVKQQRAEMVRQILSELFMGKYVSDRLSPLMPAFYPLAGGTTSTLNDLRRTLTDGMGASLNRVYTSECMQDLVIGFMIVSARAGSDEFAKMLRLQTTIFETFLSQNDPFRGRVISSLSRIYTFSAAFLDMMKKNKVLNEHRHFEGTALELMTSSHSGDERTFVVVASVALRLADYKDLKGRVDRLLKNLVIAREKKMPVMMQIVDAINKRKSEELGNLSLEDCSLCVNNVINAMGLLGATQENARSRLKKLFDHYLNNCDPSSWNESSKGLTSVAIFMKYLSYEDITKARPPSPHSPSPYFPSPSSADLIPHPPHLSYCRLTKSSRSATLAMPNSSTISPRPRRSTRSLS